MSDLAIRVSQDNGDGACVISVVGTAGAKTAGLLDQELSRLGSLRKPLVVLDLSELTFIATLGIGALLSFQRAAARHGGTVRLAALQSEIATVLRRSRLDDVLELHDSIAGALAAPAGQG
jgi:anti-sigma B factor antagonist